ncbi:serine hydrolase domain-containing protein [Paenibacillus sp. NPDC057967]|uniref:serine hydrolase domain-containing protein n=1 Tax=Paenibacillus sp. NPDC057967 TaxID=3346293 RepID=UPI0036DD6B6D
MAVNADVLHMLRRERLAPYFEPTEDCRYSNTGYICLAEVIAAAADMPYAEYMQKHIFQPAGMTSTFIMNRRYAPRELHSIAWGYMRAEQRYFLLDDDPAFAYVYYLDGIQGDGMVHTTIRDLLAFDRALHAGRLLGEPYVALMENPFVLLSGAQTTCGCGWFLDDDPRYGKKTMHGGGWPGYRAVLCRYVEKNAVIIILSNVEVVDGEQQLSLGAMVTEFERQLGL